MGYQDLPTRDTLTLKKWIVLLLVLSCVTTLFLFISYSPDSQKQLKSAAQLDSLIQVNFDRFNINASQFRTHTIINWFTKPPKDILCKGTSGIIKNPVALWDWQTCSTIWSIYSCQSYFPGAEHANISCIQL